MAAGGREERRELIARLYDRHGPSLYRYAVMLLADPAAAEDAVQEVFTAVLAASARDIEDEGRYLCRAVRNQCYSMLRRRSRLRRREHPGTLLERAGGAEGNPDERMTLQRVLRDLPPDQREVLHLHVYEGLTFQEIGDLAGLSINTIASRYRYALEKLREAFR
jgi:RNA polymerase sigma-70 factor (ECF subfamily)